MSLYSFQTQNVEFIPYAGPPEPKPTWRRKHTKTPFNGHEYLVLQKDMSIGVAPASHQAGDVDSTSTGENVCALEDFGSGCDDIGCTGVFPDEQGVEVEHFVSRGSSGESLSEKSLGRPALFEGNSPECAIVIADNQPESDADNDDDDYSHDTNLGTQTHDGIGVADFLTEDRYTTDGMKDALNPELVDVPGSQDSGLRPRELSSALATPSTEPSIVGTEQPTQEANGNTLLEAHTTMHQPQRSVDMKAETEDESAHLNSMSSDSSEGSENDIDDTSNQGTGPTRKRKRLPPCQPHTQTSSTTSKRYLMNAGILKTQRKPSSHGKLFLNRSSSLKPLPAAPKCGYDAEIRYSVDSSDSSSGNSERGRCLESGKRRKSVLRPRRSRSRGSADEDDEYEVEQILKARVYRGKLQYRVEWVGYEVDPVWYNASNFKNSPRKLHEYHTANPTRPGPPQRLEVWLQCGEEDRDADDHPDDNKPQRSHTGRWTL